MTKLVIRLLGGFRVELNGEVVYDFETDKARALLTYLVVEADRPHRRETLSGLLWPDQPDSIARARLRQTLYRLRQALRDAPTPEGALPFLFVTSTDVQFNTASDYSLDVAELEAWLRSSGPGQLSRRQLLPSALCADFLAGFSIPDSEAFEAWVLAWQERCHRLAMEILEAQGESFEAGGDYAEAVAAARLQLHMEPWLDEAHRRVMRTLALDGRPDEALRQYDACCRALQAELGTEPSVATQALYADIREGRLLPTARPPRLADIESRGDIVMLALQQSPPARLAGRAGELGQLRRHLDAALAGETVVAFVTGDAGSGKTALLEAFASSAMSECPNLLVAGARCSPGGSVDTYAPLRKLAEALFGDFTNPAAWRLPESGQMDRLQRATGRALAALADHGPELTGTLLPVSSVVKRATVVDRGRVGTEWPGRLDSYAAALLSPVTLFDQLAGSLAAIAREQPLLLLLDDLQWVDDGTTAFLLHLGRELGVQGASTCRLLVLGAYRSATVSLGRRDPHSGEVTRHPLIPVINELRRTAGEIVVDLNRADGRAFVEALVDAEPNRLGAHFRDALFAQTGGHALFTVESLRNLRARGELTKDEAGRWVAPESIDWGALPVRVEAVIAERVDRLPETARTILSAASVQGDDFTAETVAELAGLPVQEVVAALSGSLSRQHALVKAEGVVHAEGSQVHSAYRFTHHLFQKYLYDQLDPVERARWHATVAAVLYRRAERDQAGRERLSGSLAWHYEAAGFPLQAARALHDAGRQAMRVSAFREALSRFDRGLALLAGAPSDDRPSGEWIEARQLLQAARLASQRVLEGMGSATLEGALARARDAGMSNAQGSPRLMMLWMQTERLMAVGRFQDAIDAAERIRAEAMACGEEDISGLARLYLGTIHHHDGNPQEAERHLDLLFAWLTAERQARLRASTGIDMLGTALAISALNRWFLGYPEAAVTRSTEAIESARVAGNTVGQAEAVILGASLLFYLRVDASKFGSMAELSEECRRLCLEHNIGTWRVYSEVLLGWQMTRLGDEMAGIQRIRRAIAEWQARGVVLGAGAYGVVLADACLAAALRRVDGDPADRGSLLNTGLEAISALFGPPRVPCGRSYDAELHRLRGELLLARDGLAASEEALDCFRVAEAIGRQQGALAWELRAAVSIVRLRQQQGQALGEELAAARAALRDCYERFTEGFAFADLQNAAALIGPEEALPR